MSCRRFAIGFKAPASDWLVLFDLTGGHAGALAGEWICKSPGPAGWAIILSTNEKEFGGTGECGFDPAKNEVRFDQPELVVLKA